MKKAKKTKSREVTISAVEISKFGAGIMNKVLKAVNTAKKGKIIIKIEKN